MLYYKNIYCSRKRFLFMSCSELGKGYMCQEAHFKLPYENIPENEQDGIKRKVGGKALIPCLSWFPQDKLGEKTSKPKTPRGSRVCTYLNTSWKTLITPCAVAKHPGDSIPAALQHPSAGHHSQNFPSCHSQAPGSLMEELASANSVLIANLMSGS